jgi:hypothetical protein
MRLSALSDHESGGFLYVAPDGANRNPGFSFTVTFIAHHITYKE